MQKKNNYSETLNKLGYVNISQKISTETIVALKNQIYQAKECPLRPNSIRIRNQKIYAIRNLTQIIPNIKNIIEDTFIKRIILNLGKNNKLVQSFFFDKIPEADFRVPFHQDITMSFQKKKNIKGYSNWKIIAGVPQVCPPLEILKKLISVRIHLDESNAKNGPLKVIPKSHNIGILTNENIEKQRLKNEKICLIAKGGVFVMKPLLLHASGRSIEASHRRVIHLVFSNYNLSNGLEWLK